MRKFSQACHGVVGIDGKVLRRSFDTASGKSPLHMVSAWSCDQRLRLAQIATDAKSNEITTVPQLLRLLSLKGTIVTVGALNCQRAIAPQIIDRGGDYAFALKGNQGALHTDVAVFLDDPLPKATPEQTTGGRSWPHRNAPRRDFDSHRLAARTASMAGPGSDRKSHPHSRDR